MTGEEKDKQKNPTGGDKKDEKAEDGKKDETKGTALSD